LESKFTFQTTNMSTRFDDFNHQLKLTKWFNSHSNASRFLSLQHPKVVTKKWLLWCHCQLYLTETLSHLV